MADDSIIKGLRAEVVEALGLFCLKHPLSMVKIARLSGLSRPTVQRLFDNKPVCIETLYKLKKWIIEFDESQL